MLTGQAEGTAGQAEATTAHFAAQEKQEKVQGKEKVQDITVFLNKSLAAVSPPFNPLKKL